MNCFSCNEELSEKLKYSFSNNICPCCGKEIFSQQDFLLRKSLSDIFKKYQIENENMMNDILNLDLSSKQIVNVKPREYSIGENIEPFRTPDEEPVDPNEAEEVQKMIENGEVVFSNLSSERTVAPKIKKVSKPITRLS